MVSPIQHSQATGIHPGAFVQSSSPDVLHIQDGCLWVDTSSGPPYQLKVWNATSAIWQLVGLTGSGDSTMLATDCLAFPNAATLCNPSVDVLQIETPTGRFNFDATGLTIPGGHRLERVPGP